MAKRIAECERCNHSREIVARGLCKSCYYVLRRRGELDRYTTELQHPEYYFGLIDTSDRDACWLWPGKVNPAGYGYAGARMFAHRWVYLLFGNAIPDGMVLDHECHNRDLECPGGDQDLHRRCVNPTHLAPKTPGANSAASTVCPSTINTEKDVCPAGHPYDVENTYIVPRTGHRQCQKCRAIHRANRPPKRRRTAA